MPKTQQMRRATLVAALAVGTVVAGVGPARAHPAPGGSPTTRPVSVAIAADGTINAPRTIAGGVVHLAVTGAAGEALQLVAPRHGGSPSTLVQDYRKFADTGLPRTTERDFRFVGGALVGADVYLDLPAGTYFAFDAAQSSLTSAQVATILVRGPARGRVRPRPSGSITAIGHDSWSRYPGSIGPVGYLQFTNASDETHLVNLLQLVPATTLADVTAAITQSDGGDLSQISTGVYDEVGVLSPHGRELVSYALPAGTYAVLDLWPDDATGLPHSALGMVRLIHVT